MSLSRQQKLRIEATWWLFTVFLVAVILYPVWRYVPAYPFYPENVFFIVTFVTFTRYAFLLRHTFLAPLKWLKVAIIALAAILFFVMTTGLSDFHNFLEVKGLQTLVTHLHVNEQTRCINYIKNEMVFFGVGSIISGLLLPLRMIISLWRMRNRGSV